MRAVEVFRDMQGRGMKPNITTWCYLINSLSKSSRRKGWPYARTAYTLWKELENKQMTADIDPSYYATGGLILFAIAKLASMPDLLMKPANCQTYRAYPPNNQLDQTFILAQFLLSLLPLAKIEILGHSQWLCNCIWASYHPLIADDQLIADD